MIISELLLCGKTLIITSVHTIPFSCIVTYSGLLFFVQGIFSSIKFHCLGWLVYFASSIICILMKLCGMQSIFYPANMLFDLLRLEGIVCKKLAQNYHLSLFRMIIRMV